MMRSIILGESWTAHTDSTRCTSQSGFSAGGSNLWLLSLTPNQSQNRRSAQVVRPCPRWIHGITEHRCLRLLVPCDLTSDLQPSEAHKNMVRRQIWSHSIPLVLASVKTTYIYILYRYRYPHIDIYIYRDIYISVYRYIHLGISPNNHQSTAW